jgi:hypothetical protein
MNFNLLINNNLFQIVVLLILFWFLFLREDFTNVIPIPNTSCKKCIKFVHNNLSKITEEEFNKKCVNQNGQITKNNNITTCNNFDAKIGLDYNCNCNIE